MNVRDTVNRVADRSAAIAGATRDGDTKFTKMHANPREGMLALLHGTIEPEHSSDLMRYVAQSAHFGVDAILQFAADEEKEDEAVAYSSLTTLSFLLAQAVLVGHHLGSQDAA